MEKLKVIASITDLRRHYLRLIGSKAAEGTTENVASVFNSLKKSGKLDKEKFKLACKSVIIDASATLLKLENEYFNENTEGV